jgi:hypothetical protein
MLTQIVQSLTVPAVRIAAGEVLQYALKRQQPQQPRSATPFAQLRSNNDSQLAAYAAAVQLSDAQVSSRLDAVVNRRNSTVHYSSEQQLFQDAVQPALLYLQQFPALRTLCKQEAEILQSYDQLKTAFQF